LPAGTVLCADINLVITEEILPSGAIVTPIVPVSIVGQPPAAAPETCPAGSVIATVPLGSPVPTPSPDVNNFAFCVTLGP
jgi:hypothetical protein